LSAYGKARFPFNTAKELQTLRNQIASLRGLARISSTPQSIMAPIIPNASPSSQYPVNYLSTAGGAMSGAIAFNHRYAQIIASAIDLKSTGSAYSTLIYLTATGSGAVNLATISNAHDDGQLLILYNTYAGGVLTVKNNTGNIITLTGADIVLANNDKMILFFEPLSQKWNQIAPTTASGSSGANTTLSNLVNPTAVNVDLQPGTDNLESIGGSAKRWQWIRGYNFLAGSPASPYASFQSSAIDFTLLGYSAASPPFSSGDTTVKGIFQVQSHGAFDTLLSIITGSGTSNYVTMTCDGGFLFTHSGGGFKFGVGGSINISYIGMEWPVTTRNSGSYTVDSLNGAGSDFIIKMNDPSFARNVTLPDATLYPGRILIIKHGGAGFNVNVLAAAGQSIDGVASYTISTVYGGITVVSDGNNWLSTAKVT